MNHVYDEYICRACQYHFEVGPWVENQEGRLDDDDPASLLCPKCNGQHPTGPEWLQSRREKVPEGVMAAWEEQQEPHRQPIKVNEIETKEFDLTHLISTARVCREHTESGSFCFDSHMEQSRVRTCCSFVEEGKHPDVFVKEIVRQLEASEDEAAKALATVFRRLCPPFWFGNKIREEQLCLDC